uniref:Uncharacterized protein n=1 Tax=Elaeophora elaphi TaxID=1147741 RepID=A0A0R3RSL4_9BILA
MFQEVKLFIWLKAMYSYSFTGHLLSIRAVCVRSYSPI